MRTNRWKPILRRSLRGSVSVFLILILMPMFSGTYLAIDAGRTAAAKARVEEALDLTGNAALNDYDQALKDWYGVFAMGRSREKAESRMAAVFSGTIDAGEITAGDPSVIEKYIEGYFGGLLGDRSRASYDNYINTTTKSFTLQFPEEASLARPNVMERTITDYMKYRGPYQFARGVSQRLGAFRNVEGAAEALSKSKDYYKSLSGVSKQMTKMADKLPEASDTFDPEAEQKAIETLSSGLDKLKSDVHKTDEAAKKWKGALEEMPEGEAKALMVGDYKTTADILNDSGVDTLKAQLEQDRAALSDYIEAKKKAGEDREAAEKALREAEAAAAAGEEVPAVVVDPASIKDPDPPALAYRKNALFGYIAGSKTKQGSKEELPTDVDRSGLTADAPAQSVSRTVGSAVASAIDAVGSSSAMAVSGAGSGDTQTQMSTLKTFFRSLTGSTDSLMSDCYVEEFVTEMFSCYTSREEDKNPAGAVLSKGPLFRGEVEYILFGQDHLPANIHLAEELIFMVRVLFNSIYAFSNASMRAEALTAAAAIASWTGAGVAVVQNLILGAWAMAESVSDVSTLLKGGTVPLYKNAATWTMSLSGLTGKLREGATALVSHTVDDVYARIEKAADDKIEGVRDAAMSYLKETTEGAVESLTNMIITPVESRVTTVISDQTEHQASLSREDIRSMLLEAVDSADNHSAGYQAAKAAFNATALGPLTDTIYGNYKDLTSLDESISKTAATAIAHGLQDAYATLFSEVEKAVDQKVSSAEQKIHQALEEGGKEVKADVIEAIDDYAGTLSGYLGSDAGGSGPSNTALSSYSGTAMSYKDYLKVFVFAGIVKNSVKQGMLTRSAKVMQANCHTKEKSFHMAKTYRAVHLDASAKIVTHTVKGSETYAY